MQIKESRISFVQVERLADPLRSLQAPHIPFPYLLSGPLFEQEYAFSNAPMKKEKYGQLFWRYYVPKREPTTKDLWRALVPLRHDVNLSVNTFVPQVQRVLILSFLYPWGLTAVVDISTSGLLSLDQTIALAHEIRDSKNFHTAGGSGSPLNLNGLIDLALRQIHTEAYGPQVPTGDTGEIFSVFSVLDADGVDPTQPVPDGSDVHRALEAVAGWNPLWKSIKLDPLASTTIGTRKSPPGHILYGSRRGRAVWFPGCFRGVGQADTLRCFHQNLTVASLQTESLCRIVEDAANALASGQSLVNFSATYRSCVQLAAGVLGRLYGGTFDTYRSQSVRDQIQRMYKTPVSSIRSQFGMAPLTP